MSTQLLLPSAKSAVLVVGERTAFEKYRNVLFVLGVLVVLLGTLDAANRAPTGEALDRAAVRAFAPAILITP